MANASCLYLAFEHWNSHPEVKQIFVFATLEDGTVWRGQYGASDLGPEEPHPMLVLKSPLGRKLPGDGEFKPFDAPQVVMLPLARITSTRIQYRDSV